MNPDYQIITLKDGVTKAVQFAGPTYTVADLQAQIAPLQAEIDVATSDIATAQQKIADLQAQIAPIQAQIDALNAPDVVATPTTIQTSDPATPV